MEYNENDKSLYIKGKREWDLGNGKHYEFYVTILIPLKKHRNTEKYKYKKLTHVVLEDFNFYNLLRDVLEGNYEKAQKEVYYKTIAYLTYYHSEVLEKESNLAYNSLKNFLNILRESSDSSKRTRIGSKIEENVNVILKYLYGNFIPYGGKNKPDGVLILVDESENSIKTHIYIIDCKQRKEISRKEVRKMKDYLENFPDKEQLPKTNNGIFIISEVALKKNSLNYRARKELSNEKLKFGVITVEFLLNLFEIYRHHRFLIESSDNLRKELKRVFIEAFDKSLNIKTIEDLRKSEQEIIDNLKTRIKNYIPNYYPQRRKEEL